uniref:Uncharacterized protein n=1 Tax=Anguilla anguilla TaxID=7936 RepID=A0A0E9VNL6_ANGAN
MNRHILHGLHKPLLRFSSSSIPLLKNSSKV